MERLAAIAVILMSAAAFAQDWESPQVSVDAMGTKHERMEAMRDGHTLVVRCTGRKLDAYIVSDTVVDSNGEGRASIRLKFDNDKPVSETWSESTDHRALFSANPLWFVQNLVNTNGLAFEYTPFERAATVVVFHTKDMPQALSCIRFSKPDDKGNITVARAK